MTKAEYATFIYRIMYQNLGFDEVIKDNPSLFACTVTYFDGLAEVERNSPWDAIQYKFDDASSVTDKGSYLMLS